MHKIDELRQEIKSFEVEISSLEKELAAVGGRTLQLASGENSASAISKSIRQEAEQIIERQPVLKGIKDAIAELNSRLQPKKAQLGELEAQELKQHRIERIEQGRSRLRDKFADVEQAAESLKSLFFELKAIAQEYERDFAEINPPTSGGSVLNRNSLLNYEVLALPTITEENQRFILNSRFINLFEAERKAIERERLEQSQAYRDDHKQQLAQAQQRRVDEQMLVARKQSESFVNQKQEELKTLINKRAWSLNGQAATNPSEFDGAIAKLKEEIADLEKPMQP